MKTSEEAIVVEQYFTVPLARLWKALTDPTQMRQWFFEDINSFEPKEGFETSFVVKNEGRTFPHLWKIIEVKPGKKIVYNWKYEGYQGDSFVTFELFEQEHQQTRLKLTHKVIEDFSDAIPEFSRENCLGGWQYFIKQQLSKYLSKEEGHKS
ncbi:SRPBCC domain-containing protein [Porifericola rhodea]|uniref:SRPBCC family protein n=1 Tax=Porifericola rhodea TaxID=930972 RepID=UPI0026667637|nr:SRPBCC domain-containing protein [Porifericola rhodea]WKN31686.1 SRPBCC domain-containing protein [Porifericola rhodea]